MAADGSGADAPGEGLDLDAALDELYGVDPAEFVATRTRLARALKGGGDAAAARALAAQRRPTKSAGALNLLARRRPELIGALLDRSAELRSAQQRAVAGAPGSQRDATRAQREALREAADAAVALLGAPGEAARAEILSTLQGAAADDELGAVVRAGRLERTEVAASGFPSDVTGGDVVPSDVLAERRSRRAARGAPATTSSRGERPDRRARADERAAEQAREQERRREEARRQVAEELERAEGALRSATDAADAAAASVAAADARVTTLREELEAARLELRTAKDRAAAATREVARRTRDVARRRT